MPGEDQERFEDYLELERYIEELQAGHVAHPPKDLTPTQARIYRMAALFRSASPEVVEPRPEFAEQLKAQLLALDEKDEANEADTPTQKLPRISATPSATPSAQPALPPKTAPKPMRFFSRRSLLAGGAAAAASLVVGAGIGKELAQPPSSGQVGGISFTQTSARLNIDQEIKTTWQFVTTVAELGKTAVRFASDALIGYVIYDDGDDDSNDPDKGKVIAMSATCTHMGCIVQWQDASRQFYCPCHGAVFAEYGAGIAHARYKFALPPLLRLNTKVENGKIYVEVPAKMQ